MKTNRNLGTGNYTNYFDMEERNMNTNKETKVKKSALMFFAVLTVSLAWISAADTEVFGYDFSANSQGWVYMGLYDGGGLTPVDDFTFAKNPWTGMDGQGGAIEMGQEGFTPPSPSGNAWVHGDFTSPDLAYQPKLGSFAFRFDITGAHMASTARVYVQAVIVVRLPRERSDRRYASDFMEVPIGEEGAWDTHSFSGNLPAGTVVKKINLRVFFQTSSPYWGWIMVDNVIFG